MRNTWNVYKGEETLEAPNALVARRKFFSRWKRLYFQYEKYTIHIDKIELIKGDVPIKNECNI